MRKEVNLEIEMKILSSKIESSHGQRVEDPNFLHYHFSIQEIGYL